MRWAWSGILVAALAAACGAPDAPVAPAGHDDAGLGHAGPADGTLAELPPLALGLSALEGFAWRKRAGQPAFNLARKAEDKNDWRHVAEACGQALAADPGHLEAAWLLAVALGRQGAPPAEILAPLTVAVAGDFGKWGPASLEQPALAAFLATPSGAAWQRRIALDAPRYAAALSGALLVTSGAELYAYEARAPRWYRLTRTYGAVVGALAVPDSPLVYYVTSRAHRLQVGVVDLTRGHSSRPQELGSAGPFTLAHTRGPVAPGAWIGGGAPHATTWRQLDDDGFLHPLPPRSTRPGGPWLEMAGKSTRVHRLPVADVTADWDDRGLASAIRLGKTSRVVTVPTGQIDGDTVEWSPDGTHLALVAVLDEHCTPGAAAAAAFVVDAATGTLQEVERATGGLSVAWIGERRLAVAGDRGVSMVDLGGGAPVPLAGATDLLARKRRPRCTPDEGPVGDEPTEPDESESEPTSPASDAAVTPGDAR